MIMSDAKPRQTAILDRGEYLKPTEKVSFATPGVSAAAARGAPANRLGLARWLVMPEHPLTARVQVNRMWQHFFGAGIVKTSEDFGVQSEYPVHGELLDWLAVEFRERGWSMKAHASADRHERDLPAVEPRDARARARDPREPAVCRGPAGSGCRRCSCATGRLAPPACSIAAIGGAPVYPYQPDGIWEALAITKERDFTYPASSGKDLYRRSLYTFWRRTVGPANMFDASNRQTCRVRQRPPARRCTR